MTLKADEDNAGSWGRCGTQTYDVLPAGKLMVCLNDLALYSCGSGSAIASCFRHRVSNRVSRGLYRSTLVEVVCVRDGVLTARHTAHSADGTCAT